MIQLIVAAAVTAIVAAAAANVVVTRSLRGSVLKLKLMQLKSFVVI